MSSIPVYLSKQNFRSIYSIVTFYIRLLFVIFFFFFGPLFAILFCVFSLILFSFFIIVRKRNLYFLFIRRIDNTFSQFEMTDIYSLRSDGPFVRREQQKAQVNQCVCVRKRDDKRMEKTRGRKNRKCEQMKCAFEFITFLIPKSIFNKYIPYISID